LIRPIGKTTIVGGSIKEHLWKEQVAAEEVRGSTIKQSTIISDRQDLGSSREGDGSSIVEVF